jgi:5-methyltetrahydrofolate--homocysteine methyltransferase
MRPSLRSLGKEVLILDGAMGTMLQAMGLGQGVAPDVWNLEHPEAVAHVHQAYLDAGAQILTTNTFGSSVPRLKEYGLEPRQKDIVLRGLEISRGIAQDKALVAGDIGPLGLLVSPLGDLSFEDAAGYFYEQARLFKEGGADLILIETFFDIQEARAAVVGVKEAGPNMPLFVSLTYGPKGTLDTGTPPEVASAILDGFDIQAFGVNCSLGPKEMFPIIESLLATTPVPVLVQPNAGLPVYRDGRTTYPLDEKELAEFAQIFVEKGVAILGGCCGTTPGYIRRISQALKGKPCTPRSVQSKTSLASRSDRVRLGEGEPFVLIGEKINPTGKKAFQKELQEQNFQRVIELALSQVRSGALALDINVGVPLSDESALMRGAVMRASQVVEVPLVLDSSFPAALKAGLEAYPGRALVNSVNAEPERLEAILPLIKRFGASVICLLSEDRIPETAKERLAVLEVILKHAEALGVQRSQILVDCLCLTVSAMQEASRETLRTIQGVREHFGLPTTIGLSNVSFGLPERRLVNRTFLAMAMAYGLDAAILDPTDKDIQQAILAASLFSGRDPGCKVYLSTIRAPSESMATGKDADDEPQETKGKIYKAVFDGDKERIVGLVEQGLQEGLDPLWILTEVMTPALKALGDLFGLGKKFLPHLILAADAMRRGVEVLEPVLQKGQKNARTKGRVVFATVKGDIHDIGKNLCCLMLRNFGFEVIDLGRNVPMPKILDAAIEHNAEVIGLSALMTTTMLEMKAVIEEVKKRGLSDKVMVGGAAVTQQFAEEIHADGYGKDVSEVVSLTEGLLGRLKREGA